MRYADQKANIGRGFGCAAMLVIVMVPLFPLLFVLFWSGAHCEPIPECQRSSEVRVGVMLLAVVVAALLVGTLIAKTVNRLAAKRDDDGYAASFLLFAGLLTAAATALTLLGGYTLVA